MKIKIGGNFWDVEFIENLKDLEGKKEMWGLCLPDKNKILIEKNLSSQVKFDTILHECIHAILMTLGIETFIKKHKVEDFTMILTTWLNIFLRDNDLAKIRSYLDNEGNN